MNSSATNYLLSMSLGRILRFPINKNISDGTHSQCCGTHKDLDPWIPGTHKEVDNFEALTIFYMYWPPQDEHRRPLGLLRLVLRIKDSFIIRVSCDEQNLINSHIQYVFGKILMQYSTYQSATSDIVILVNYPGSIQHFGFSLHCSFLLQKL